MNLCDVTDIFDLEACPSYEAVSYVWGTSETRFPIQVSCNYGNAELVEGEFAFQTTITTLTKT